MRYHGSSSSHYYGRTSQKGFGGIVNTAGAGNGDILEMSNMSSDDYPVLATRPLSYRKYTLFGLNIIAGYGMECIDGDIYRACKLQGGVSPMLFRNGDPIASLFANNMQRSIVKIGTSICVFPDKMYYDTRMNDARRYRDHAEAADAGENRENNVCLFWDDEDVYLPEIYLNGRWQDFCPGGMMEYSYSGAITIKNGTYGGESATANTIEYTGSLDRAAAKVFEVGDAVTISGCDDAANNKTAIIREIEESGGKVILRFYENTFEIPGQTTYYSAKIERKVPDMDFVFCHNNRLWGCKDKSIYSSKLGNPFVWADYDSLADGSWSVDIADGKFTGACAYSYPRFFTRDHIYTIYGDYPMEYQMTDDVILGCEEGSDRSFAIVAGRLFYKSPYGFVVYTGSLPYSIDSDLGTQRYHDAIGGAAGYKYYVACKDAENKAHTFVYDTKNGTWHEEVNAFDAEISGFAHDDGLLAEFGDGIYTMGIPMSIPEGAPNEIQAAHAADISKPEYLKSRVLFAPWTLSGSTNKKQVKDIHIRHRIEPGASITVRLYIDGVMNETFHKIITGDGMTVVPGIPRRCDYWQLELTGKGEYKILDISYKYYEGTEK